MESSTRSGVGPRTTFKINIGLGGLNRRDGQNSNVPIGERPSLSGRCLLMSMIYSAHPRPCAALQHVPHLMPANTLRRLRWPHPYPHSLPHPCQRPMRSILDLVSVLTLPKHLYLALLSKYLSVYQIVLDELVREKDFRRVVVGMFNGDLNGIALAIGIR